MLTDNNRKQTNPKNIVPLCARRAGVVVLARRRVVPTSRSPETATPNAMTPRRAAS